MLTFTAALLKTMFIVSSVKYITHTESKKKKIVLNLKGYKGTLSAGRFVENMSSVKKINMWKSR